MPQVSIDQSWSHYIKINFAGHKHNTESSNPSLKFRPFSDYVLVSKVCWIRFSSWESFIGFHIWGCPILTSLACLFTVCVWISWKKLCWKESDGGWVFILCLPSHVLYCIDGEFEKILTKLRLRIKDNNNHLYRVSGAYLIEWPWGKRLFEEICYHKSYCYPRRWKRVFVDAYIFFRYF